MSDLQIIWHLTLVACQRITLINPQVVGEKEQIINLLQKFMFSSVDNPWLRFVVGLKVGLVIIFFLEKRWIYFLMVTFLTVLFYRMNTLDFSVS